MRAPATPSGIESASALESLQRGGGRRVEPTVELRGGQTESPQAKLERGDVPADAAGRKLSLTEQRPAELAELAASEVADLPGRPDPVPPLQAEDRAAGHRPGDAVDLALVEAVRAQRDLQRRHLGALRSNRRPGDPEGSGDRDDDHDAFDARNCGPSPTSARFLPLKAAATILAAAFPGSSIGRASGC